jgi:hypothetical protein
MTWADGQGYRHIGVRGLLLTDSIASLISGIILLALHGNRLKKPRQVEAIDLTALAETP